MARYNYSLSENSWEYVGVIEVEASEKPICVNTDDEHSLEVNGVKIFFDEEIEEANI